MQAEERSKGAVSNAVYAAYFRAGRGELMIPMCIISIVFMQGAQVMTSYWLVYWQELYVSLSLSHAYYLVH